MAAFGRISDFDTKSNISTFGSFLPFLPPLAILPLISYLPRLHERWSQTLGLQPYWSRV